MSEYTPYVSVPRFAELVSLSSRTCWVLIQRRVIPVYRIGRRTLVKTREGMAALEQAAERTPAASAQPESVEC